MWTPKPRGKVMRRPKPSRTQHCRKKTAVSAASGNRVTGDPHRDIRYFGLKHSDITRMYFRDPSISRNQSPCPPGRFEKKQTDITAYLEHVIPSHASQAPATLQPSGLVSKRSDAGDIQTSHPSRPPTNVHPPSRSLRADNIRPVTAPTGEMKRLSAGSTQLPAISISNSGTAGSKRTLSSKMASQQASRPGTRESKLASPQSSCRVMTGTSHSSGCRLQSVPE